MRDVRRGEKESQDRFSIDESSSRSHVGGAPVPCPSSRRDKMTPTTAPAPLVGG
jgi:hypothetical protein